MTDCNAVSTPMEPNVRLSKAMCPETPDARANMAKVPYRELIGKLLYLAVATRPDISYAVGVLCRFVKNPGRNTGAWLGASFSTSRDLLTSSSFTLGPILRIVS